MKNIPKNIYLNIGKDCDELVEVTWSKEPCTSDTIEYISVDRLIQFLEITETLGGRLPNIEATKNWINKKEK